MKHVKGLLLLLLLPMLLLSNACHKATPPTGKDDNSPSEYQMDQVKAPIAYDAETLPVFSMEPGVYHDAITVSISLPSLDLVIRYTTNCQDPAKHSPIFDTPLPLSYREEIGSKNGDVTVFNIRAAAFGMAVYCSHGMERTHLDGIDNTINLLLAYLRDI